MALNVAMKLCGEKMFDLYNGDCLEIMQELIEKGVKVDAIITDPPYGTSRCKWDSIIPLDKMWNLIKKLRKNNIPIVIFGKEPFNSLLRISNIGEFKYDWIWKKDTKSNFPQAPYQPLNNLEIISVFSNGIARYGTNKMKYNPQMIKKESYKIPKISKTTSIFAENHKNGVYKHKDRDTSLRYPYNILEFNTDKSHIHPTQKPVELMEYLIKTYTNEEDIVLDFTMGSGTTGVACKNLNRKFIGIELDEKYFNIAKNRIFND
jgi:site-specific DNA-methyltransferase (adenine-specific)